MKKIAGFNAKTVVIEIKQDVSIYNLGDYIDEKKEVLAVSFAYDRNDLDTASKDGIMLIDYFVLNKGYLTLVDDCRKVIIKNKNLLQQTRNYKEVNSKNTSVLIPPSKISWEDSFIEFSNTEGFDEYPHLEMTVLYTEDSKHELKPAILLPNGLQFLAPKQTTIKIKIEAGKEKYTLGNGNPFPKQELLVGFKYSKIQERFNDIPATVDGSIHFTLEAENQIKIDSMPIIDLIPIEDTAMDYFPVVPVCCNDVDWKKTYFKIDKQVIADYFVAGKDFLVTIYHQ